MNIPDNTMVPSAHSHDTAPIRVNRRNVRRLTRSPRAAHVRDALPLASSRPVTRPQGRVWYPARLPGQRAYEVVATRPHGVCANQVKPGDRFGSWTVRKVQPRAVLNPRYPRYCWQETHDHHIQDPEYVFESRCDCGTPRTFHTYYDPGFLHGQPLSCGCWRRDVPPATAYEVATATRTDTDWSHTAACLCQVCVPNLSVIVTRADTVWAHTAACLCQYCLSDLPETA